MARNGSPDDPNYSDSSDPTQYANLGGSSSQAYSEYEHQPAAYGPPTQFGQYQQPAPPSTWHRKPAVLIGLGVLTAVVLAFLVYAVVKFTGTGTGTSPAGTSATSTPPGASTATSGSPGTGASTETVTESPTQTQASTTEAPTSTQAPSSSTVTSTTTTVSTSTSTVTVTTSRPPWPTLPTLFPRPTNGGQ